MTLPNTYSDHVTQTHERKKAEYARKTLPASNADKVRVFHDAIGVSTPARPTLLTPERYTLRRDLIEEELLEWITANSAGDIVEVADALADLLYVVYGTAHEYGLPIDAIFAEVHRSNMTKFNSDGTIPRRADGKALKAATWEPPRIKEILDSATLRSTGS
jgi:predicted HAD superfamily Cof-like phosphohydrolase